MGQKWHDLKENDLFIFIVRTAFYFIVLAMLVYLYSYRGINNGTFIYNEF
ncbi:teichoic acid D-Ala incorporation-associated protein DltX [Dellaglioa sp. L3N]